MREILVRGGRNAGLVILVDDEDYPKVERYRWRAVRDHNTFYAYARVNGRHTSMHQLLMNGGGRMIDHIDRNGLNNQRNNLRFTTNSANQANGRPRKNSVGFRGVSRVNQKFRAQIKVDGKTINLGRYGTPEAAAMAYDAAVRVFHGDHATVNFGGDAGQARA